MDNIPGTYSATDWFKSIGSIGFGELLFDGSDSGTNGPFGFHVIFGKSFCGDGKSTFDECDCPKLSPSLTCFDGEILNCEDDCGLGVGAFDCCSNRFNFFCEMKSEVIHASCQLIRQWESCWNIC